MGDTKKVRLSMGLLAGDMRRVRLSMGPSVGYLES